MESRFQPSTKTKKWGLGLVLFSVFGCISFVVDGKQVPGSSLLGLALTLALGLYLWFSSAPSEYFAKRKLEKHNAAESQIASALNKLEGLTGVKTVLAYENLEYLVRKTYKKEASAKFIELLDSVSFDRTRVESKLLGTINNKGSFSLGRDGQVRVYKDWVVAGKIGFDFDISTRGAVTVDGSIQYGKNNQKFDNRSASLQLATQDWSHSFSIDPDEADEARRILKQLEAIIEQLKPQPVSASEIAQIMDTLLSSTGKSPAEKLEELSNLRYQRLLTDIEFEKAKGKILGI